MRANGPHFIEKHIKPKAIFITKMTPPHDWSSKQFLNTFNKKFQTKHLTWWHQNKTAICLISMFTDAHLHYAAFELLKSVDTQTTNIKLKFLPCNLLVKHGTSQLTTILSNNLKEACLKTKSGRQQQGWPGHGMICPRLHDMITKLAWLLLQHYCMKSASSRNQIQDCATQEAKCVMMHTVTVADFTQGTRSKTYIFFQMLNI